MRLLLLALACSFPCVGAAARFSAIVSHVTDGDTVWVRPAGGGAPQQVRIDGIDAPEICQAYGSQAREALAARVLKRRVVVITRGEDDYRRTIGRLQAGRQDVGAWMVSEGYAWSHRFRGHPGPYVRQEARARDGRKGLWAAAAPESPRDFRVRHGSCRPNLSP